MVAAGAPSSSPMRKPPGATVAKHAAAVGPGFQPSAAAQSDASAISSGRITRMRRSCAHAISPAGPLSPQTLALQRGADLLENQRIVDRRRHGPGLAVGDLLPVPPPALPRP